MASTTLEISGISASLVIALAACGTNPSGGTPFDGTASDAGSSGVSGGDGQEGKPGNPSGSAGAGGQGNAGGAGAQGGNGSGPPPIGVLPWLVEPRCTADFVDTEELCDSIANCPVVAALSLSCQEHEQIDFVAPGSDEVVFVANVRGLPLDGPPFYTVFYIERRGDEIEISNAPFADRCLITLERNVPALACTSLGSLFYQNFHFPDDGLMFEGDTLEHAIFARIRDFQEGPDGTLHILWQRARENSEGILELVLHSRAHDTQWTDRVLWTQDVTAAKVTSSQGQVAWAAWAQHDAVAGLWYGRAGETAEPRLIAQNAGPAFAFLPGSREPQLVVQTDVPTLFSPESAEPTDPLPLFPTRPNASTPCPKPGESCAEPVAHCIDDDHSYHGIGVATLGNDGTLFASIHSHHYRERQLLDCKDETILASRKSRELVLTLLTASDSQVKTLLTLPYPEKLRSFHPEDLKLVTTGDVIHVFDGSLYLKVDARKLTMEK